MDLGTRLKNLRVEKGLSQRDLATIIGCSHQTIATLERNENNTRIGIIEKLCRIFNVTSDYLIYGVPLNYPEEITIKEIQMILKYRDLSDYYKFLIDHILESGEKFDTDHK